MENLILLPPHSKSYPAMLQRYNTHRIKPSVRVECCSDLHIKWPNTFAAWPEQISGSSANFSSLSDGEFLISLSDGEMRAVKSPASRIRIVHQHSISISPTISSHRGEVYLHKCIFLLLSISGIPSAPCRCICNPSLCICIHRTSFQNRSTLKPFQPMQYITLQSERARERERETFKIKMQHKTI